MIESVRPNILPVIYEKALGDEDTVRRVAEKLAKRSNPDVVQAAICSVAADPRRRPRGIVNAELDLNSDLYPDGYAHTDFTHGRWRKPCLIIVNSRFLLHIFCSYQMLNSPVGKLNEQPYLQKKLGNDTAEMIVCPCAHWKPEEVTLLQSRVLNELFPRSRIDVQPPGNYYVWVGKPAPDKVRYAIVKWKNGDFLKTNVTPENP